MLSHIVISELNTTNNFAESSELYHEKNHTNIVYTYFISPRILKTANSYTGT